MASEGDRHPMSYVQAISTIGLGAVLAWFAFQHFMSADREADQFMRDHVLENIKAETESAKAMERVAASLERFAEEMDDVTDMSRESVRRFDRMFPGDGPILLPPGRPAE